MFKTSVSLQTGEKMKETRFVIKKSWVAYWKAVAVTAFLLIPIIPALMNGHWLNGLLAVVMFSPIPAYLVLQVRSYKLYCDENGIWAEYGFLPWNKGLMGVKWRDLDEAVYYQGFWNWILKSYPIRVGHRYTKKSEIYLNHMSNAKNMVWEINRVHQEMIKSGAI